MSASLYLCLHLPDFAAQAAAGAQPELRGQPLAILSGQPPLESVFGLNPLSRQLGVETGMRRLQAESFPGIVLLRRNRVQEERAFAALLRVADEFSPRVQVLSAPDEDESASRATLVLDISASEKLLGSPRQIAVALARPLHALGWQASIGVSGEASAALMAARGRPGITVMANGEEAQALAPLPLAVLELNDAQVQTFAAWGIHTLGQIAALPLKSLVARLGEDGHRLQLLARGRYPHLLVPDQDAPDAPLLEHLRLEHPVELLEPLLFLLGRALEQITRRALDHAQAIASVEISLQLETSSANAAETARAPAQHRRLVRPALPEQDFHILLKLVQLDLELHPPPAPIVAFTVSAQPARRPRAQQGLFAPQSPEAGRLEVLLARLRKLVGEGRVGSPELLDSHAPDAFRMAPFQPGDGAAAPVPAVASSAPALAMRSLRPPLAVRVGLQGAAPRSIFLEGQQLPVVSHSGPWRADGAWWTTACWCREEWDVAIDAPERRCLRLAFDPGANCWYLTGIYD